MASINRLYHVATMKYDAVKRFNDNMASQQGNMGKWQETDTKFGWWLLDTLHLDFLVLATSDHRWWPAGTYGHPTTTGYRGDSGTVLHDRMAFPIELARIWLTELQRTDRPINLELLLYRAWAWCRQQDIPGLWEDGFNLPDDLSCLDGFRIYIGLLNRIWDRNWKHRLDTAMARLRGRMVTPTLLFGYTAEALPCSWQNLRFYTEHALLDNVLDKYVHQKLYFSPAIPTMTTMGASNMIFLRAHVAVEMAPTLRQDQREVNKLYFSHSRGLEPFEGTYLVYVDVCREAIRSTLDLLNVAVGRLGLRAKANPTPIRSFGTTPMRKRVTLLLEFEHEPTDVYSVINGIWGILYKGINWEFNQIMVGPVSLYRMITVERLYVITAQSFAYTTSKMIWANLAAGVPLQPRKALWKLDPESSQDDLICAVEEYNSTAPECDQVQAIGLHGPTEDKLYNVWSVDRRELAVMPFSRNTQVDVQDWWGIQMRIKDYPYLDTTVFLNHTFKSLVRELNSAGWEQGDPPMIHIPQREAHSTSHREHVKCTFPNHTIARAFYYVARDLTTESSTSHQVYQVEVWNPTFNHELLNEGKVQTLAMFMATNPIRAFTPQMAAQLFPRAAVTSMEQLLTIQTPASASEQVTLHSTTHGGPADHGAQQGADDEDDLIL